jgi:hypothetical protein
MKKRKKRVIRALLAGRRLGFSSSHAGRRLWAGLLARRPLPRLRAVASPPRSPAITKSPGRRLTSSFASHHPISYFTHRSTTMTTEPPTASPDLSPPNPAPSPAAASSPLACGLAAVASSCCRHRLRLWARRHRLFPPPPCPLLTLAATLVARRSSPHPVFI